MLISAKEIINKSLELLKRDFHIWILYMGISFVSTLLGILFAFNPTVLLFFATLGISSFVVILISMLLLLGLAVFNVWFNIALVRTIHKRLFNSSPLSLKQQFAEVSHILPRTIGVSFVVGIIVFLPIILGIVGLTITNFENILWGGLKNTIALYIFFGVLGLYGIFHLVYFSTKYVFSYYYVTIEEKHIRESLHQGQTLVRGRMGEIFWRLAAPVMLFFLVYILSNYIFTALARAIGGTLITTLANLLSLAVSSGVALVSVIATVILFEDVKTKVLTPPVVKKG